MVKLQPSDGPYIAFFAICAVVSVVNIAIAMILAR